ncbi:cytochrome P450 89A2-like [Triticum dicoccoides]|uniref:cytochrome P450 89A2-like n=1 Tax=Triticum dicoccoides TaxID=85692 RepID=UPI00188FB7FF|nr:cytochrome P450 89A2-like [Triticum dicoccoides]
MEFVLTVFLLSIVLCISAVAVFRRRAWAWAVHDGQQPIIEIHDPTIARRALIDHADAFCNRPLNLFPVALVSGRRRSHSDNLTSMPYGPRWRALRCTLNAAVLHPSRLGHTDPLRLEAMDTLVADLRVRVRCGGGGEIVVRDILNAAVFPLVARMCFGSGVDEGHVCAMRDLLQAFVLAVDGSKDFAGSKTAKLLHWRQWRRFLAFRGMQAELFLPLVNARRNTNRHLMLSGGLPAYLDHLLDARVPVDDDTADGKALRPLTDDELVSLLSEFLGAGPGTVVSSMEWTLAHLVLQPEVQNNIRREVHAVEGALSETRVRQMKYMHAVVLESLRLHPPIPVLLRDVPDQAVAEILGCAAAAVPTEGMRAHFNLGEIGRDKNAWTDPDAFRPERFLAGGEGEGVGLVPGPKRKEIKMMPFGAGQRACPGGGLATMHVKSFVAALVREFEWEPPARGGVDLTELDGFFKVMKSPLRARVTPR